MAGDMRDVSKNYLLLATPNYYEKSVGLQLICNRLS
jgi:hypothetical protein